MLVTEGQFLELLACIFGGIVIGIVYDVVHVSGLPKPAWVTAVLDIVFVILAAGTFVAVTYLANFGEVRLYSVAGFVIGFAAEQFSIKVFVANAARAVYNYMVKLKGKFKKRKKKDDRNSV